jgi:hypothetical protein
MDFEMSALAIDLYCGLGGWAEGFLSEGYDVIGFDIEARPYPGQLVLQDVLTIHGAQFHNADVIVASPPCQEPSYRAMPWSRAKALNAAGPPVKFIELFEACFRIQREASEAAGRYIPLIVENVKGAQPWVGRAKWHFGSFYLWGDVPALMPITGRRQSMKLGVAHRPNGATNFHGVKGTPGHTLNKVPGVQSVGFNVLAVRRMKEGQKTSGHVNQRDGFDHTRHLTNQSESDAAKNGGNGTKNNGGSWFGLAHNTTSGKGQNPDGRKVGGDWFATYAEQKASGTISPGRMHGSKSNARKQASAMIAKIPFPLASYLARVFKP